MPGVTATEVDELRPFPWRELDSNQAKAVTQRLTVVLGSTQATSKQLRGLHAGSLMSLDQEVASPVAIYSGMRLVAYAEMVEESGELAFRVTRTVS
jgi:flagellar motor switch/type III secretory pathway protein FliN